jgi:glucose/arabinose dehydrogenase
MTRGAIPPALALCLLTACTAQVGARSEAEATPHADVASDRTQADPAPRPGAQAAVKPRITGGPNPAAEIPNPPWDVEVFGTFNEPWAMTFLPDGRVLVTEKNGALRLFNTTTRTTGNVTGVPSVLYGGQGGLGDVVLHPRFGDNGLVYISYAEAGPNSTQGAAVARARLVTNGANAALENLQVVWRQSPKVSGTGHYSHRIAFGPDGMLWITSGDRQKEAPAQDLNSALGKVIRLRDDGTVPTDNPFAGQGGTAAQVWSYGHRNLLGIAFDGAGRLWTHEHGPAGGDELNLIERGSNYGWPNVSNGSHYDGTPIPDHAPGDGYNAPEAWWNPVIAPAGFIIYSGSAFPYFRGHGLIGGLASQAIVRVTFDGTTAREAQRYAMGRRIRELEQGPDGMIWVLEDGAGARLLKLTPKPY